MSSAFGQYLKLSIFGQSHGEALGVTLDGFPAGMTIDMEQLLAEMARRAPGQSLMTTARKEPDAPEFLSGVLNGRTTGQPICAIIRNTNQRSRDYGDGVIWCVRVMRITPGMCATSVLRIGAAAAASPDG